MKKKQQIIVIHGGSTFANEEAYSRFLESFNVDLDRLKHQKDWKDCLEKDLGPDFDVFQPRMPNATNARYEDWKKIFVKILEKVDKDTMLIGHSLGALFLIKYLSENDPPKRIKALFLVAAPFDNQSRESFGTFAIDPSKIGGIQKKVDAIRLYYGKDDLAVTLAEAKKYENELPNALLRVIDGRAESRREKIPEIIADVRDAS